VQAPSTDDSGGPDPGTRPASRPVSRREVLAAALVALLLAAWPLRGALLDPSRVLLGVDVAAVQLPWSGALAGSLAAEDPPVTRPRNPGLSDQAVQFYPVYRWLADSLAAGELPLWNPLIYAGVPALGNPQVGLQDPQVWPSLLLDRLFGVRGFHYGQTLAAWARIAASLLGAYLLARRLGLGRAGAATAGAAFGLSGFGVLWLGQSLGHVPPLLPWVLLFLEGIRVESERGEGRRARRAAALAGVALLLAVLAGHPETSFYVGLLAGLWALRIAALDRSAGVLALGALALGTLAASASLLPFVEYLGLSGAKAVREAHRPALPLAALGTTAIAAAVVAGARQVRGAPVRAALVLAVSLALCGLFLFLARQGLTTTAPLALLHDLFGQPGHGAGYRGEGAYLERASPWIAPIATTLALAAVLTREGPLRGRGLLAVVAGTCVLLSLKAPGVHELVTLIPFVGMGDTVRIAPLAALAVALLAGEGLEHAARGARAAAVLTVGLLVVGVHVLGPEPPTPPDAPPAQQGDVAGFLLIPPPVIERGEIPLEGWMDGAVPAARVRARIQRVDGAGAPAGEELLAPGRLAPAPTARALELAPEELAGVPDGARYFAFPELSADRLGEGALWRFTVEFLDEHGEHLGQREARTSALVRPRRSRTWTLVLVGVGLGLVLASRRGGAAAWAAAGICALQGLGFAEGQNPAIPEREAFPPTRTEELLAAEQGHGRYLAEPGVLGPNTGMVRGLRALDGYDAMDVAEFNAYRFLAIPEGANALLSWNARGVLLDAPAFRVLGVRHLVLAAPLDHHRYELVAGPAAGAPRPAETWIYRDREPWPRAFCAREVTTIDETGARWLEGTWDPLETAAIEEAWRPAEPFTTSRVEVTSLRANEVRLTAELDGDGLLVLTDQDFPGWAAEVDGEPAEHFTVNAIFRGVPLAAGEHEVVFHYRPASARNGLVLSVVALGALLALAFVPRRVSAR
jgi:hypothetical protein